MSNINPGKMFSRMFMFPRPGGTSRSPSASDASVQQAAVEAAQRRNRARGFQSTILSQFAGRNNEPTTNGAAPLRATIGS